MTEAARLSLIELFVSGGLVLGLLLWQLWSVKREQRRYGDRPRGQSGEAEPPQRRGQARDGQP